MLVLLLALVASADEHVVYCPDAATLTARPFLSELRQVARRAEPGTPIALSTSGGDIIGASLTLIEGGPTTLGRLEQGTIVELHARTPPDACTIAGPGLDLTVAPSTLQTTWTSPPLPLLGGRGPWPVQEVLALDVEPGSERLRMPATAWDPDAYTVVMDPDHGSGGSSRAMAPRAGSFIRRDVQFAFATHSRTTWAVARTAASPRKAMRLAYRKLFRRYRRHRRYQRTRLSRDTWLLTGGDTTHETLIQAIGQTVVVTHQPAADRHAPTTPWAETTDAEVYLRTLEGTFEGRWGEGPRRGFLRLEGTASPQHVSRAFNVVQDKSLPGEGPPPRPGGPVDVLSSDVRTRTHTAPVYPDVSEKIDVDCIARVEIDVRGKPGQVDVEDCPEPFADATRAALQKWSWYPYRDSTGQRVPARVRVQVRFKTHN